MGRVGGGLNLAVAGEMRTGNFGEIYASHVGGGFLLGRDKQ